VVGVNNFIHGHSVSDVIGESSVLDNFQGLLAGVLFFIELSDQIFINSGVFFI
jgi:hypothetical protein